LHTLKYRLSRLFYTWRQQGKEREREKPKKYGANAPQLRAIWPESLRKGKTQKIRRKCATVARYLASSSLRSSFAHLLITTDTIDTIDTIDTNLIGKTLPNGDTP
jgi:hypothetical protein